MDTGGSFHGLKRPVREANHSTLSDQEMEAVAAYPLRVSAGILVSVNQMLHAVSHSLRSGALQYDMIYSPPVFST